MLSSLVSIIIPVFNCENYLEKCLESIQNQSYKNWECICIDDGSSDSSKEIVNTFVNKDSRFSYFYQDNSGPSAARNAGLEKASGEYIVFVDSDDYIDVNYIDLLYSEIKNSNSDVCCCGYTYISENETYKQNDYLDTTNSKEDFLIKLFTKTGGTVCSKIYKKDIIDSKKIRFHNEYRLCEDQLFALEFFCNSDSFFTIDTYGYYYNKGNDNSIVSNSDFDAWLNQIQLIDHMESYMKSLNINQRIIDKVIQLKFQNTLFNLMSRAIKISDDKVEYLLSNRDIGFYLKKTKIDSKFSIKYIMPIKIKSKFLIRLVY